MRFRFVLDRVITESDYLVFCDSVISKHNYIYTQLYWLGEIIEYIIKYPVSSRW